MISVLAIFLFGMLLAYANGANDNFKGVATLYGSGAASYRRALVWTSLATFAGALTALVLARELIIVFKGVGLVPDDVIQLQAFPLAVGLGAATTVLLATRLSLPVSTTHALIGALAGAGWMASPIGIDEARLAEKFFLPLIAGPALAIGLALALYPLLRRLRRRLGVEPETCLCVGNKVIASVPVAMASKAEVLRLVGGELTLPHVTLDSEAYCRSTYRGAVAGVSVKRLIDAVHYLSSGLVCFARGLNDTPKIAALLLIGSRFPLEASIFAVGIFMLLGGLAHSRRIAETMGHRITDMNPGQALTANLVTGALVLGASRIGVPVSTTHVSCGSLFGIGAVTGRAHGRTIGRILLAWATTLPLGMLLGATAMGALA